MKKISKWVLGSLTALGVGVQATVFLFAMGMIQSDTRSVSSLDTGSIWRKTRFGWQDSSRWTSDTFVARESFELIHPVVWATLVLIAVVGVMFWASDEWEVARIFDREQS